MYDSIRNSQKNSLIPFKLIKDYPYKYQSYLGRIYGYLLNQIIWWKETHHSIMFHDIENIPKIEAFNNFQVNEKDTSNNLLNPKPETDLITTNSCLSL